MYGRSGVGQGEEGGGGGKRCDRFGSVDNLQLCRGEGSWLGEILPFVQDVYAWGSWDVMQNDQDSGSCKICFW